MFFATFLSFEVRIIISGLCAIKLDCNRTPFLLFSKRFERKTEGRKEYLEAFSVEKWRQLPVSEMKLHSALNCLECVKYPRFALKISNRDFINRQQLPVAQAENECDPARAQPLNVANIPQETINLIYKTIPKNRVPKKIVDEIIKEHLTLENIPSFLKRQVIGHAQKHQQKKAIGKDLKAIFLNL